MAKEVRGAFTRTGGYVARKAFRFSGRDFTPGDPFPWRMIGCSTRRLRQLYAQRFIDPAGDELPEEEVSPETTAEETSAAADETTDTEEEEESEEDEDSDESDDEDSEDDEGTSDEEEPIVEFTFDPAIHEVVNPKRGKWYITMDGEVIETIYRQLGLKLKEATEPVKLKVDEEGDLRVVE